MVFNATFNKIAAISGRSVLLVKETRGPGENERPVASHWQILSHNVVSSLHGVQTHNISVIGTDYTGSTSCKSTYHHWCCGFESRSGRGVQHYVIKFVSDLRQVGGFLRVLRFPPPIQLTKCNTFGMIHNSYHRLKYYLFTTEFPLSRLQSELPNKGSSFYTSSSVSGIYLWYLFTSNFDRY